MGANEPQQLVRRNLHLSANERLIFDYENGKYRVAYYRSKKPWETGHEIAQPLWERLTRAGMLPQRQRSEWYRVAAMHSTLDGAIREVLRDQKKIEDVETLLLYIRSTEWGKDL